MLADRLLFNRSTFFAPKLPSWAVCLSQSNDYEHELFTPWWCGPLMRLDWFVRLCGASRLRKSVHANAVACRSIAAFLSDLTPWKINTLNFSAVGSVCLCCQNKYLFSFKLGSRDCLAVRCVLFNYSSLRMSTTKSVISVVVCVWTALIALFGYFSWCLVAIAYFTWCRTGLVFSKFSNLS